MVLFWPQQFRNESRGQMPTGRQVKKDFCAFLKWEYPGMLICLYDNCLWAEHFLLLCQWFYLYQHTYTWMLKTSALTKVPCENNPKCICIVPVSGTELFAGIAYLLVFCKTDIQLCRCVGKGKEKKEKMAKMRVLHKFKCWIDSEMVSLLLAPSSCMMPLSCHVSKSCCSLWVCTVLSNLLVVKIVLL